MSLRILFYIQRNLQLPFLEPVQEQLSRLCPNAETAFCAPPFITPQNGQPGWGLEEQEVQRLQQKARFVRSAEEFRPDITVFADACTNVFNCGKRVFVGHGIISKGGFYTENELVRRENLADLICVPGPWHKQILEKNVFSPIHVTGFIKSDRLFGPTACTRADFCKQYAIPDDATIILYAPTFNAELSAIPCLGEQIAQVCEPDRYLVIKLHTMTDIVLAEMHRRLAANHPRIRYIEDIDVTPAMAAADILISDVSSVLVEFMGLDRPVIAVNNPRQQEYEGFRADDIEYQVRDACHQVGTIAELLAAVETVITQPDALSPLRRRYADALCYGRDGRSAQRVAEAISALATAPVQLPATTSERYAVLLKAKDTDTPASLLYDISNLVLSHPTASFDLVVWGMSAPQQLQIPLVREWLPATASLQEALQKAADSTAPWLVLLEGGLLLPERSLHFLANYFRWNPALAMVRALTVNDDYRHLVRMIYPELGDVPVGMVANLLLATLMGREVPMEYAAPGCCMLQNNGHVGSLSRSNDTVPVSEQIWSGLKGAGQAGSLALDLFAAPIFPITSELNELERLIDHYQAMPDDLQLLNRLLATLVHFNQLHDAHLVWQHAAKKGWRKTAALAAVWGGV